MDPNDAQKSPTYAAMVKSLDDNVGRVLDKLDELKLSKNTLIFFLFRQWWNTCTTKWTAPPRPPTDHYAGEKQTTGMGRTGSVHCGLTLAY